MTTRLFIGGAIYSPAHPFAEALLVDDGRIAWIGSAAAADAHRDGVDEVVELDGALVTPAFVDAHVHATNAGLTLIGLDLTDTQSRTDVLERVESESRRLRGAPLIGHGWDESGWPDNQPPTAHELDRASAGGMVYLSRRDVHSALVSSALMAAAPDLSELPGFSPDGWMRAASHGRVRQIALETVGTLRRDEAQRAFLSDCAAQGIASIHECAGPVISSPEDLRSLQVLASDMGVDLQSYWGELGSEGIERALSLGARPGGDLFVDGSLGSHTAWLSQMYDDLDSLGNCYIDEAAIEEHLRESTRRGVQAGFHAIGDAAITAISVAAQRIVAEMPSEFRALKHRIEHLEMATPEAIAIMVDGAMVASAQPTFDWLWGGANGMYAERLGMQRANTLNRFADWQRQGLALAFSSDAPVTPSRPWEWIRAAMFHSQPDQRLTARSAFAAATRGGRRAAGQTDSGVIDEGAVAALAIWASGEIVVQTPDERIAAWSTDARSGVPGLPEISLTGELPRCIMTINGDHILYRENQ